MRINYTSHAENQLKERRLNKALIEKALTRPDEVKKGSKDRKVAHKLVVADGKERLLRVIYEENKDVLVITAYLTEVKRYGAVK